MKTISRPKQARSSRSGFSLIELIIAVTIMSALAAVAVPVAGTVLDQGYSKASRIEMKNLAEATQAMYRDTWTLPTEAADLLIDPGTAGWSGPYLPGAFTDKISGLGGYEVDGWSVAYDFAISGYVLTITSAGPDGTVGSADDLALPIDVTPILRDETLERLDTINAAVQNYNLLYQLTEPLPAGYASIRSALVAKGYLPDAAAYETDAWGDAFTEDPLGLAPVVRVTSTHLAAGAGSVASGGSGGWGSGHGFVFMWW
jgi:general secretion pathway protein G